MKLVRIGKSGGKGPIAPSYRKPIAVVSMFQRISKTSVGLRRSSSRLWPLGRATGVLQESRSQPFENSYGNFRWNVAHSKATLATQLSKVRELMRNALLVGRGAAPATRGFCH